MHNEDEPPLAAARPRPFVFANTPDNDKPTLLIVVLSPLPTLLLVVFCPSTTHLHDANEPNCSPSFTTISGNNVVAYKSSASSTTAQSTSDFVFNYTYTAASAPATSPNLNAARTNMFYLINTVHDSTYRYRFTKTAYNFQTYNFGEGGCQGDHILMSVQDSSGTNNANFATPADGQSRTACMYIWTYTTPNRDGAMENDIVVHEMTHGVTNCMTGSGTGSCLQTTEAGRMGEGWSDAMAQLVRAPRNGEDEDLPPHSGCSRLCVHLRCKHLTMARMHIAAHPRRCALACPPHGNSKFFYM